MLSLVSCYFSQLGEEDTWTCVVTGRDWGFGGRSPLSCADTWNAVLEVCDGRGLRLGRAGLMGFVDNVPFLTSKYRTLDLAMTRACWRGKDFETKSKYMRECVDNRSQL
jgi:hypothetical protein